MKILLTGGLGYIGSHIANILGRRAIIIDNQSNSNLNYKKYLPQAVVYKNDLNKTSLNKIFLKHRINGVIHLAGLKAVRDSIQKPLKYYRNNIISSMDLIESMEKHNVNNLIFSSSASVYGNEHKSPLKEDMSLKSVSPYASTKIIIENLINDYSESNPKFHAISLRYFNPIGADSQSGLYDKPLGEPQNLMPLIIRSIKEKKVFKVFGNDYPTKDGTCIRDYIHVKDLASAHLEAFQKLSKIKGHISINLGLGKGASVFEIISLFEKVNKTKLKYVITKRRKGDSAVSYANNQKAKSILKWKPKYSYIDMVRDAWQAESKK